MPQFNRRRVLIAAAIVSPFAIAAGLGVGKLYAIYNPVTINFPEMCVTTEPTGEASVSMGACQPEELEGV
jgi:hypothetical protein